MNKKILILIVIVAAVVVIGFVVWQTLKVQAPPIDENGIGQTSIPEEIDIEAEDFATELEGTNINDLEGEFNDIDADLQGL